MTNIALVVLDTLRKDAFDEHFDWLPGQRFENAWSTSHWTVPAHASLFTGKIPSEANVHAKDFYYDENVPTLPAKLGEKYTAYVYTANPNISPQFGATKDFDEVVGDLRLSAMAGDVLNWDRFIQEHLNDGPSRYLKALRECFFSDVNTLKSLKYGLNLKLDDMNIGGTGNQSGEKFLNDIRETTFSDNSFVFMNLMEAHAPYNPPEKYGAPDVSMEGLRYTFGEGGDPKAVREAYDASVRYLSDLYSEIFNELQKDFDTIVTVSDHGELLGEHGGWEHLYGIYPELSHIPLVVSGDPIGLEDGVVNLQDIHDAIVDEADSRTEAPVEYHGLNERNRIGAENKGVTVPDYMEKTYVGVATADGYAYESFDDAIVSDGVPDAEALIEKYQFTLTEGNTSVSNEVEQHLKDLGYA
ncbi:arylsulfatase [Halobacteriales archaeon QS_6_71_20]|nr:MAG: arylsulfatase [Halobacteriales archaeon QS_6_71_20]